MLYDDLRRIVKETDLFLASPPKMNQKNVNELVMLLEKITRELELFRKLPLNTVKKAILLHDLGLYQDSYGTAREISKIKASLQNFKNKSFKTRVINLTDRLFYGSNSRLPKLLSKLVSLYTPDMVPDEDELKKHILARRQLRIGNYDLRFVFFRFAETGFSGIIYLFENELFVAFLRRNSKLTFEQLYDRLTKWFAEKVAVPGLERAKGLFESYYGRDYRINFTAYFSELPTKYNIADVSGEKTLAIKPGGTLMQVNPELRQFGRRGIGAGGYLTVTGWPERGDFRVSVNLPLVVFRSDETLQATLLHELAHLFNVKDVYVNDFTAIKREGLAELFESAKNPGSITSWRKAYRLYIKYAMQKPLTPRQLDLKRRDYRFKYVVGLHMWLVIYLSKLNAKVDLTELKPGMAQFLAGEYEKFFTAWFWRFRNMNDRQAMLQYLEGARKLGVPAIFSREAISEALGSEKI